MKTKEFQQHLYNAYAGTLFNYSEFTEGEKGSIVYEFDCPGYTELKQKYPVEQKAGKGSDFKRTARLVKWLAPKLKHNGNYCKDIPMNAISLLDYSYDKPECGINCVCKSKILMDCCLSLGIYARWVGIYPASCYDMDNHYVNEIYDRDMQKWIMFDLTQGGYFVDERKTPLSLLEIRENIANGKKVIFAQATCSLKNLDELYKKNSSVQWYFAKNLCYFCLHKYSSFDLKGGAWYVVPKNFDIAAVQRKNADYKVGYAMAEGYGEDIIHALTNYKERLSNIEYLFADVSTMQSAPQGFNN